MWTYKVISKQLTGSSLSVEVQFTCAEASFNKTFKTDQPQDAGWLQSNIDETIKYSSLLLNLYNSITIEI